MQPFSIESSLKKMLAPGQSGATLMAYVKDLKRNTIAEVGLKSIFKLILGCCMASDMISIILI